MREDEIKDLFIKEVNDKNVKPDSPQWWSLKFKYDMMLAGAAQEQDAKQRLIITTVHMVTAIKKIQRSSFSGNASSAQVMEIYGATAALYAVMEKYQMIEKK